MTLVEALKQTKGSIRFFCPNRTLVVEVTQKTVDSHTEFTVVVGKNGIEDMIDELTSTVCREEKLDQKIQLGLQLISGITNFRE